MRLNEQNILVLSLDDWKAAGLTFEMYKNARRRNQIKCTRGCPGRPVEIEYDSLPVRYQNAVIQAFGNPYEVQKASSIKTLLKRDADAYSYYHNYTFDDQTYLSDSHVQDYSLAAEWLNALTEALKSDRTMRNLGYNSKQELYDGFAKLAEAEEIRLPYSARRLNKKHKEYTQGGNKNYQCLISGKFGNSNTLKIEPEAAEWIIAEWSLPTTNIEQLWIIYNAMAIRKGWKLLKASKTLYDFVNRPDIQQRWYPAKHGLEKAKQKFSYESKTNLPKWRDALWYGDGTKLNFYYRDENGKTKADLFIYALIDTFSEVILGWGVGENENFKMQYDAAKMAVKNSGYLPYEMRYDNQGGHKKNKAFLNNLARVHYACRPYNGKSKTIENIFGRIQMQVMSEYWFFTGQNITAKSQKSRANMEFVLSHQKQLPTKEEAIQAWKDSVDKWNNAQHTKYAKTRIELYTTSVNPDPQPVDELTMVDIFWLQTDKPRPYYNHGISIEVAGVKHEYEVRNGIYPDQEFRSKHIDDKFIVKYDPDDWSQIRLYTQVGESLKYVAIAEPRIEIERAIQSQGADGRKQIDINLNTFKQEADRLKKNRDDYQEYAEERYFGNKQTSNVPSLAGVMKNEANMMEIDETDYLNLL